MQPVSSLLLRNATRISDGRDTLVLNPDHDLPWRDLCGGSAGIRLFTQDFTAWRHLDHAGAPAEFGVFPDPLSKPSKNFVLVLPREKDRLQMWLHWCAGALPETGTLWLAGENRAGIRSSGRYLAECFDESTKIDSARHCSLFQARTPRPQEAFELQTYLRQWTARMGGEKLRLSSLPGVFAHGRPDAGTRLLLDALATERAHGKVLDFGCGSGIIGIALKKRCPDIHLTLVDNNALALEATSQSLALNGITADAVASDGFSELEGPFDLIITNPPFHRQHRTDPALSIGLLGPVRNFLAASGQLLLVVNRHLPYRRWLNKVFGAHEIVAADSQFQVLRAVQC